MKAIVPTMVFVFVAPGRGTAQQGTASPVQVASVGVPGAVSGGFSSKEL